VAGALGVAKWAIQPWFVRGSLQGKVRSALTQAPQTLDA
jgi:hypothetical protein